MIFILYLNFQGATSPTLALKLRKPKNDKKVKWTTETVDNEHMNKKKSKCKKWYKRLCIRNFF